MMEMTPKMDCLQRDLTSHFSTDLMMAFRFSGSDFMMVSNSAYLPGRKNTLVRPKLKSLLLSWKLCRTAWK